MMGSWISVSNKLPEIGEYVLVHLSKKGFNMSPYIVTGFSKYGFDVSHVTHWQTLVAPEEGEGMSKFALMAQLIKLKTENRSRTQKIRTLESQKRLIEEFTSGGNVFVRTQFEQAFLRMLHREKFSDLTLRSLHNVAVMTVKEHNKSIDSVGKEIRELRKKIDKK